jgi:RimJ/RimL family protein N-acetyltransferase
MTDMPELVTPRLVLRNWRDGDLAEFAAINADPQVMAFFPRAYDRAESDGLVARIRNHAARCGFGLWAMEAPGEAPFMGFTGLWTPDFEAPFTPCVEIGWRLAPRFWGRGYATEAARASLRFGFEMLQQEEIVSYAVTANERSRRVMERIGMTRDLAGDFDHPKLPAGNPLRRHVLYRLSRVDWIRSAETGGL